MHFLCCRSNLHFLFPLTLLVASCSGAETRESHQTQSRPLPKNELWVELSCPRGQPTFGDYSALIMPHETVYWSFRDVGRGCRIYGALVSKTIPPEQITECDIRFRSIEISRGEESCLCIPGRYPLEEGRPISTSCCEKGSIHCGVNTKKESE